MSRYKPVGWKSESYRHYLAAKGVKTRFFAPKTTMVETQQFADKALNDSGDVKKRKAQPIAEERAVRRFEAQEKLERLTREKIVGERIPNRAIADVSAGAVGNVYSVKEGKDVRNVSIGELISDKTLLTPGERDALKSSLKIKAVEFAKAGIPLTPEMKAAVEEKEERTIFGKVLPFGKKSETEKDIELLKKQRELERQGAGTKFAKEFAGEAALAGLGAAASAPFVAAGVTAELAGEGIAASQEELKKGPAKGVLGQLDDAKKSPFFRTNAFIGNEEDGAFKIQKSPSLSSTFDSLAGLDSTSKAGGSKPYAEVIQKEVDSLHGAKGRLGEVSKEKFLRGKGAFKRGDREGLVAAITDVGGEEEKLRDRMRLVEQTRAEVLSPANRMSALRDGSDSLFSFFGGGGGDRLADQTEKVNSVREALKSADNEVSARKQLLLFDLQRMDASVPVNKSLPLEKVAVVREQVSGSGKGQGVVDILRRPWGER